MVGNIIVKKTFNKYTADLFYKNFRFICKIGSAGISKKKIEGDGVTPLGIFRLLSIYYREDRVGNIFTKLPKYKINRHMGWSDDPKDPQYNKLVRIPRKFGFEKIFRKDKAYDIIIITDFNSNPVVPNKGSAIFIHCDNGSEHTHGCVSLKKRDILRILPDLSLQSRLIVR
tara:strand:- start:271 stop:783 length:513 start_codon:yes stop_codon:yes gene_type:complete